MTDPEIEALMPADEMIRPAWASCVRVAMSNAEALEQFREDTGNRWVLGRTSIDRMIDDTTGAEKEFILAFIRWHNRWIWGEVDGRACNGDEPVSALWAPEEKL